MLFGVTITRLGFRVRDMTPILLSRAGWQFSNGSLLLWFLHHGRHFLAFQLARLIAEGFFRIHILQDELLESSCQR